MATKRTPTSIPVIDAHTAAALSKAFDITKPQAFLKLCLWNILGAAASGVKNIGFSAYLPKAKARTMARQVRKDLEARGFKPTFSKFWPMQPGWVVCEINVPIRED